MDYLIETLQSWYPLVFISSAGFALTIWILSIRYKARKDIRQAAELVINRRDGIGQTKNKNL